MSSSVCQGLQSCLEPWLVEPRVLAPPKSNPSPSFPWSHMPSMQQEERQDNSQIEENKKKKTSNNSTNACGDLGGWSFIQALSNTSQNCKEMNENIEVYVHPIVKRSASTLSTKSLEMCTESLGSETGSEIGQSSDEFSSFSHKFHATQRSRYPDFTKKFNRTRSFPPPLSSISGSEGIQVMPQREGGRLVMKAVTVSSSTTHFEVQRVDGRLKLALLHHEKEVGNDEEAEDVVDDDDVKEEVEEEDDDDYWDEDMKSNKDNAGCEIGIGEIRRPGRCKESESGNEGMPNWVAIS